MRLKRPAVHTSAFPGRGGLLARIWLKIRRILGRLTGREAKKNPNIYPLY